MKKFIIEQLIAAAVVTGGMAFGWAICVLGLGAMGVL